MNFSLDLADNVAASLATEVPQQLLSLETSPPQSLSWLWQVVGATICWALSDVICDVCIHTPSNSPSTTENSAEAEKDKEKDEAITALNSQKTDAQEMTAISSSQSAYHPRGSHQPPTPMCAARTMPRARERKVRAKVKAAAAFATPNAESEADPKPTPAEFQPTLGDKNSGEDNSVKPLAQPQTNGLLTPEQNALVSGCVALLTVLLASSCSYLFSDVGLSSTSTSSVAAPFLHDLPRLVSAVVGGSVHFMAYFLTLCAYSSASSTVITPLMQLSAVWMLPFSTLAACMGLSSFIRPVHLLSVALICTGGFLPAAGGCLSHVASSAFWKQRAVRLVILAELLVCLYNVILHQTTFEEAAPIVPIDFEPVTPPSVEPSGSTMQFFLLSRLANGVTCLTMFLLNPSLRVHVSALRNVNFGILATAFAGECLSMMGVCMVTFSYSSFYEPSVVNAAEGGLQQLFNLLFALISKYVLGCGREVEQLNVKLLSFLLVSIGLGLSTF